MTSDRYVHMIEEFLPKLNKMSVGDVRFQQDGTTVHAARVSMTVLRQHFPGRLLSLRSDLHCPVRSPDLVPCDYLLWVYIKSLIFNDRPNTLHLKCNIRQATANIPIDVLDRVE
ncbi:hypothetical protein X975_02305, partial [Stegodyphus mimosarum]